MNFLYLSSHMCFTCRFQASGNFNKKSDVYNFGIIFFELITGRAAIIRGPVKNNHILDWVNPLIERGDVQNIIDPRLEREFNTSSTWKAIEIAIHLEYESDIVPHCR